MCEACDAGECPIGDCDSKVDLLSSPLRELRKIKIYFYFDQTSIDFLVIREKNESDLELAERFKPGQSSSIVTIYEPSLKDGSIEFNEIIKIEFETVQKVVTVELKKVL